MLSFCYFTWSYLIDDVLVPGIEVQVKILLLVETLAATPAGPLRGPIPLLFLLAWRKHISQRMQRTLQGQFHL